MQRFTFLLLLLCCFRLSAQKIIYSESISEDNSNINFEILGKVENNYLVYKNVRQKHMMAVYNEHMKLLENRRLTFVPERTFNLDFIIYPAHFYMVYQYQKRNTIWCMAVKMNGKGEKLSEPVLLDSSRVGLINDKKIYSTVFSEDRKKILVYKMLKKNDQLTMVTKLYNTELALIDSNRQILSFDDRREIFTDISLSNDGTLVFARGSTTGWRESIKEMDVVVRAPRETTFTIINMALQGKFVDDIRIKVDNLNRNYIVNSLFLKQRNGTIDGLFTAVIPAANLQNSRHTFNLFQDSLRYRINAEGRYATAFDNLYLRNIYVKKDGGFIISAEDSYTQTVNNTNNFNRYNSFYNSYPSNSDYWLNNQSYNNYYRPYNRNSYPMSRRYFYSDIVVLGVDSSLKLKWSNVIHKKQEDTEQDNFLSFANVNSGSEIHFLFTDSKKMEVVNNHSVLGNGQMKRYATLKSHEAGYEFMPKLAKQVGTRQVIVPCLYLGSVAFAKIDFSE